MKATPIEFIDALPWLLLHADDLVVTDDNKNKFMIKSLINGRMMWKVKDCEHE